MIVHQEAQEGLLEIANGKTKNFHSGARHLTTTVTFPFESFTESVSDGMLSSIPYLVGKKRRMTSVLVISNSIDQEKAIMVNSECELGTTSAGGMAQSRIALFQC